MDQVRRRPRRCGATEGARRSHQLPRSGLHCAPAPRPRPLRPAPSPLRSLRPAPGILPRAPCAPPPGCRPEPFAPRAPLHLRHEARLEGAARAQLLRGLPAEEQVLVHELQQHEPHQLAHVLAANELLVSARRAAGSSPAAGGGGGWGGVGERVRCSAAPGRSPRAATRRARWGT